MTIPDFDENGNLPPGIHWTTYEAFEERFGTNGSRWRQIEGLKKAMEHLKNAGCRTIYINGSFMTDKPKPNDFDACWDTEDVNFKYLQTHAPKLLNTSDRDAQKATYKGEIFPSEEPVGIYAMNSLEFFQRDRAKKSERNYCYRLIKVGSMIKNQKQYEYTQELIESFESS